MNNKARETDQDYIASVVIPAHNEASVIERLLRSLPSEIDSGKLQVIVACNGCTDSTAEIARKHGATVVEVATASKIAALNAADEVAVAFPRLYVDADVVITSKAIIDLVHALADPQLLCAAPPSRLILEGRHWTIRAYFSVWLRIMRAREGYVGAGVYAVSRRGRARFGKFPNVIADDLFVRNSYTRAERRVVQTDPTIVESPRTLRALFRRRIRVCRGNAQLLDHPEYGSAPGNLERNTPWWQIVLANPTLIPASLVYAVVNTIATLAAQRHRGGNRPIDWARDNTTRPVSH